MADSSFGGPPPESEARVCPFLDTIQRPLLDFDMQKLCSVSLSPNHVYACLVCGKFFEGRGRHTHAFTHSVQAGHHVFINLTDGRTYCLPDMYEVVDASLADIKTALIPRFTEKHLAAMDSDTRLSTDVLGVPYLPGFVGLNNLNHTDGLNAVIHALVHVHPLRNFFLDPANYASVKGSVVQKFGELLRRVWSPVSFKSTVSPIEFITEVSSASGKRFSVGVVPDALEFLTWLLNTLHAELIADYTPGATMAAALGLGSSSSSSSVAGAASAARSAPAAAAAAAVKRPRGDGAPGAGAEGARTAAGVKAPSHSPHHPQQQQSLARSIITDVFQGEVEVETLSSELPQQGKDQVPSGGAAGASSAPASRFPQRKRLPFLFLSLELPPTPLYKDDEGSKIIAQIPLYQLLAKFDGATIHETLVGQYRERRRYRVTRLPPYLILHLKRFSRNQFFAEKNPTIVTFPVRNLELRPYVSPEAALGFQPPTAPLVGGTRSAGPSSSSSTAAVGAKAGHHGAVLPGPDALAALPTHDLKALVARLKPATRVVGAGGGGEDDLAPLEKGELLASARAAVAACGGTKFDLVANVCHHTPPESGTNDPLAAGTYRVHVQHGSGPSGQWYEIQDLHVTECLPQMIGLSEAYLLVYKRQSYRVPVSFR